VPRFARPATWLLLAAWLTSMVLINGTPAGAVAPTLFVDKNNSSCSDSGAGTQTQPFCTIGKAASIAVAGQTVTVNAGSYAEDVNPANSGTATSLIVFTAASGATVTVLGQTNGWTVSGRSFIKIHGFAVTQTTGPGISVSSSSNITIDSNHVSFSGQPISGLSAKGILVTGSSNSLIVGNQTDHNSDAGISLGSGNTGMEIKNNVSFSNASQFVRIAPGIETSSGGTTIDGNITHDNEDSGINVYSGATNNLIFNNVAYHNSDHGIDTLNATGQRYISNSVYNNVTSGLNMEGNSSGGTMANNISVDNGINSPRTVGDIRVDSNSASGTTIDFDIAFYHTASTLISWAGVSYATLQQFQTAVPSQEVHGIQADPLWKSAGVGDFHIVAGSPAIDSANSGVSGESLTDADGNPRVDDPATPNTGAGPRAYDDRGAYEFQPAANTPPVAALTVTPSSGVAPLAVTADASASTDTDSTPISTYRFDFGDGTIVGPQTASAATHTYGVPGTYAVTVTVTGWVTVPPWWSSMVTL